MHSVTDRRSDGRHDDANNRLYCVVVGSDKMGAHRPDRVAPHFLANRSVLQLAAFKIHFVRHEFTIFSCLNSWYIS